ncbi:MAG: methylmalonyl Co-A mutase-associated GTPase MeaB [Actinomycetota bacterium]
MSTPELTEQVLAGDRRAVARAISMVEDGSDELSELSAGLFPHTGNAHTVGLTGAPGVGKSSLAEHLVRTAREHDRTVAVLAIDPTSPFTGGALLGDRLRMQTHATDPGVFIRSMATRGHLGGMSLAAPEAVRILDASGKDLVVVETVGVGQVEVDIATAADTTLVVVQPGMGDSIQAAKAGILEIADIFVVNKADRDGVQKAVSDLETMIDMGPEPDWRPPVVATSTVSGEGIEDLWNAIANHLTYLDDGGLLGERRAGRLLAEVEEMVSQRMKERVTALLEQNESLVADLKARRIDPYGAAGILLGHSA